MEVAGAAVPLILASLGGLFSERAGVLNISLEGCMTAGAFTTVLMIQTGMPPLLALVPGILAGAFFGALLGAVHIGLGGDLFISGLGINLLIPSLAGLSSQLLLGHKGAVRIPETALSGISTSGIHLSSFAALLLVPVTIFLLKETSFGRKIRAVGNDSGFLAERGVSPGRIRLSALIISSGSAALAGGYMAIRIGAWVPGISAGRGWIALVIIWLGFRRPMGILFACYFFSLMEITSGRIQGSGGISSTLFLALPYLTALAALILATIGRNRRNVRSL